MIGDGAATKATAANTTVLGSGASASLASSVALGSGSAATAVTATTTYTTANALVQGKTFTVTQAPTNGVVAIGNRQIQAVADGEVSATSTNAINGSQLFNVATGLNTNIGNLATSTQTAIGGGILLNPDGTTKTAPTFTVAGSPFSNVGAAIAALANGGAVSKYFHANSTQLDSSATGTNSVAIGGGTTAVTASGAGATAIGGNATAGAKATGTDSIAIGGQSVATNAGDVAIGQGSTSKNTLGAANVAIGQGATSTQNATVAIGWNSAATNTAGGSNSGVAIGALAKAVSTSAAGSSPVAIGSGSNATGAGSQVAIGDQAVATGIDSIALGGHAGSAGSTAAGNQAIAIGQSVTASGTGAIGIGLNTQALANNVVSIGNTAKTNASGDVAIGLNATATGTASGSATSIGNGNTATGAGAVALGDPNVATGSGAVAIGLNNTANGQGAVAMGDASTATGQGSVALGNASNAKAAGGVALGDTAVATNANDVALGSKSVTAVPNTGTTGLYGTTAAGIAVAASGVVSVGSKGAERQIQNVAAGIISATSTDAINGSQLFGVQQGVNAVGSTVATALGGGAAYDPLTGKVSAPSYSVYGSPKTNVGAAIAALQTGGPVQYSTAAATTTPSATSTPSNNTTLVGAAAGPVTLSNVAPGSLTATSTDAVNGSQVNTGLASVATTLGGTATFNPATGKVSGFSATVGGTAYTDVTSALQAAGAGFKLTTAQTGSGVANGTSVTTVAPGSTATVTAGNNIITTQTGATIAVALNPALTGLTSVAVTGGPTLSATGIALTKGNTIDMAGGNINNLAAGSTVAGSTQAVNGGQLNTLGSSVATNLGGGSKYDPTTGTVTAPSYTVGTAKLADVGSAIAALQSSLPVQYSTAGAPTTANGLVPSQNLTLVGAAAGPVKLDNLAPGSLAVGSTQAINGGQLNTGLASVASSLGGTSSFNPATGQVTAGLTLPTTGATNYGDVQSALNALATGGAKTKYFNANSTLADSTATGTDSVAVGPLAVSKAANGVSIGNGATATNKNDVALGAGSVTAAPNTGVTDLTGGKSAAVQAAASTAGTVSVGSAGAERQIQNVAAGTLTATSTDAVNGSQLFSVATGANAIGTTLASTLGSGATYTPGTGITGFSSPVGGTTSTTVGGALAALDTAAAKLGTTTSAALGGGSTYTAAGGVTSPSYSVGGTTVSGGVQGAVATLQSGAPVQYSTSAATTTPNGYVPSNNMTLVGAKAGGVTLDNVAAGSLASTSTQAVNGSQLNTLGSSVATNIGGTAKYDPATGTVTGASFTVGGKGYTDITSAIQAAGSGFNLTTGKTGTGLANGTSVTNIAPGSTATVTAGNNIITTQTGASVDVALNPALSGLTSVGVTGGPTLSAGGIALTAGNTIDMAGGNINNLAAGSTAATSTQAVNGGQLNTLGSSVATNLGGGSKYDPTSGTVTAPSYTVGSSKLADVGSAITALQTGLPVQYSTAGAPTTANGLIASNNMTLVGATPGGVVLDNVAPGLTTTGSTQAINGGQLNTGLASVATNIGGGSKYDPSTGTVTSPAITVAGTKYTDLTSAIQAAGGGFNLTTAQTGSGTANGTSVQNIAPGSTATITAGNNIITTQTGATIAVAVNPALTGLTSVAVTGGPTIDAAGIKLAAGNTLDMGNNKIVNLAAGSTATGSTDAVNGGQLNTLGASTATNLGGGSTYDPTTGKVTAPSYTVGSSKLADVGAAIAALQTGAPVQYATAGAPTTANGLVPSQNMTLVGAAAGPVTLDNVAPGSTVASSTQAINGGQLNTGLASVATNLGGGSKYDPTTGTVTAPSYTIGATAYNNVGSALGAINTNLTTVNAAVTGGAGIKYFHTNSTLADSAPVGADSVAIGPVGSAVGDYSVAAGKMAQSLGVSSIAMGDQATANAAGDVAIGKNATATGTAAGSATSIGNGNTASGAGAVALGDPNVATGSGAVAVGLNNTANGQGAIALGNSNTATGQGSVALGNTSNAKAAGSVALGDTAVATNANDVALGSGSVTSAPNTGAYSLNGGSVAGTSPASVVSVGSAGKERQITNVAAGVVSATSTDAINGSQLFTTATAVNNLGTGLAKSLGGGAAVAADGKVTAPSYTVGSTKLADVGAAIAALQTGAPVQYATAGAPTTANGLVPSQNMTLVGAAAGPVTLDNVAPGSTATGSTQAINGGQLNTGLASVATNLGGGSLYDPTTGTVTSPTYTIAGTNYNNVGSALGALASGGAKQKYFNATSTLADSTASGTDSVAIGPVAVSKAANGVSIGNGATATNKNDVALGAGSVTGVPNTGVTDLTGGKAQATNPTSVVSVGSAGAERQITNVAAGTLTATSTDAVNGSQLFSVATGANAIGTTLASTLGSGATYTPGTGITGFSSPVGGTTSTTVGGAIAALDKAAQTQGAGLAAALGGGAKVAADGTVTAPAFTVGSSTYNNVDAALTALQKSAPVQYSTAAAPTTANGFNASNNMTLVGAKAGGVVLDNLAAGSTATGSTQAINGGQLNTGLASIATNLGGGSKYDPTTGTVTSPTYAIAGSNYTDVGGALSALANGGAKSKYFNSNSTLADSTATGTDSVAVGPLAVSKAANGVSVGNGATANNANDVALGAGSTTAAPNTGALTINGGVIAGLAKAASGVVSVGSAGNERQITNVAAGVVSATSTDATNGSQLFTVATAVNTLGTGIANALGAGAKVAADGTVTAPAYTVGAGKFADVGSALAALQSGAPVQYSTAAAPTTANGLVPSQNMTLVGAAAGPVTLSNVAAGALSSTSTDAVNGSQLNATNQQVAALDHKGVQYATDPVTGATKSEINLLADQGGPVVIHNLAPGVANTDAVNVNQLNAVAAVANNGVQYDKTSTGGKADSVTFQGGTGAPVSLKNVAAGVNGTDAVNLSQLKSTNAATLASANAYTDSRVNNLAALTSQGIKEAKQLAITGAAIGLAASGLRYDDRAGHTSMAGATSFYKGEVGLAVGIGHTSEDLKWRTNLSVSGTPWADKAEIGVVVGATYTFD